MKRITFLLWILVFMLCVGSAMGTITYHVVNVGTTVVHYSSARIAPTFFSMHDAFVSPGAVDTFAGYGVPYGDSYYALWWHDGVSWRTNFYGPVAVNGDLVLTASVWTGTNTNCTPVVKSITITGDGFSRNYVLFRNNEGMQGAEVTSGTYTFYFSDNPCSNWVWSVKTRNIVQIQNSDGGFTDSYSPVPNQVVNTITGPNPLTQTNSTPPPDVRGGNQNDSLNPDSTNAPIRVTTTNTAPANNGTLLGVGDGIVNAINRASDRNHNDLSQLRMSNSVSLTVSNNLSVTNSVDTNSLGLLSQIATNTQFEVNENKSTNGLFPSTFMSGFKGSSFSNNVLPSVLSIGTNVGGPMASYFSNFSGALDTNFNLDSEVDGVVLEFSQDVNGIHGTNFVISYSALPAEKSWLGVARTVISWVVYLLTFCAFLKESRDCLLRTMNQRQIQGNKESLAGFNAALITAFIYAGVIVALFSSLPTAWAAWATGSSGPVGAMSAAKGALNVIVGHPLWGLFTSVIPVGVIVTAFLNWLVFRYLICTPAVLVVGAVILCLLA